MAEESVNTSGASGPARPPVSLPTYALGDEGRPDHFVPTASRDDAAVAAKSLIVGDAAFIKRSDLKWTYAVVTERIDPKEGEGETPTTLRFEVDKDRNRKSFPEPQWGKYIRVIKCEEEEMTRLKAEAAAKEAEEAVEAAKQPKEAKPEEAPKEEVGAKYEESANEEASVGCSSVKSGRSTKSAKSTASWFSGVSGLFGGGGPKKTEKADDTESGSEPGSVDPAADPAEVEEEKPDEEIAADAAPGEVEEDGSVEVPILATEHPPAEPTKEDPAAVALATTSFPKPDDHNEEEVPSPQGAHEATPEAVVEDSTEEVKKNPDPEQSKVSQLEVSTSSAEATPESSKASESKKSSLDPIALLRTPLSLTRSISLKKKNSFVKMFGKNEKTTAKAEEKKSVTIAPANAVEEKKSVTIAPANAVTIAAPSVDTTPKTTEKEGSDTEASEVDPTDLSQPVETIRSRTAKF